MRFFRNATFDFLAQRKRAYLFSGAMLLIGLLSLVLRGGPQYGVDFTGGTQFQVQFTDETSVAELRDVMASAGLEGAQIQRFGGSNDFLVRTAAFEGVVEQVNTVLVDAYGEDGFSMSTDAVGPPLKRDNLPPQPPNSTPGGPLGQGRHSGARLSFM